MQTNPPRAGKLRRLLLAVLWLPVVGLAGYKPGLGWPEVTTPFYRAASPVEQGLRMGHWQRQAECVVRSYRDTGSMRPVLVGSQLRLAMEHCRPHTALLPGMMVQFNRGDYPAVLHYVAAVSADGRSVYLSGLNSRRSDGWFARERVTFVVREVITTPTPVVAPLPLLTARARR